MLDFMRNIVTIFMLAWLPFGSAAGSYLAVHEGATNTTMVSTDVTPRSWLLIGWAILTRARPIRIFEIVSRRATTRRSSRRRAVTLPDWAHVVADPVVAVPIIDPAAVATEVNIRAERTRCACVKDQGRGIIRCPIGMVAHIHGCPEHVRLP